MTVKERIAWGLLAGVAIVLYPDSLNFRDFN
jgi:hypothetical protein